MSSDSFAPQIDVNYLDSNSWVEQDMRERFSWLRENDPVYWSESDEVWVITKYAAKGVAELLQPCGLRRFGAAPVQGRQLSRGVQAVVELLRFLDQCRGRDDPAATPEIDQGTDQG